MLDEYDIQSIKQAIISLGGTALDPYEGDEERAVGGLLSILETLLSEEEVADWLNEIRENVERLEKEYQGGEE